jgi:hypothetical protein
VDLSEGERRGYQKKTLKCEVRGAERHRGVRREGSVQAKGGFLAADIESKVESGEWRVLILCRSWRRRGQSRVRSLDYI